MSRKKVGKNRICLFLSLGRETCVHRVILIALAFLLTILISTVFASAQQISSSQPSTQKAPGDVRSTVEIITGIKIDPKPEPDRPEDIGTKDINPAGKAVEQQMEQGLAFGELEAENGNGILRPKDHFNQVTNTIQSIWMFLQEISESDKPQDVEGPKSVQTTPEKREEANEETKKTISDEEEAVEAETAGVKDTPTRMSDFSGGWGSPKRKAPPSSKPGHVTNFFFDTPIREALSEIAMQVDEIIVPDSSIQGLITCDLKEVPLEKALDIILSIDNFAWRRMDGFIFVGSTNSESPSYSKFSETRRLKMNYLKAEDAVKMLSESMQTYARANITSNTVSVTAPAELLERILSDLRLIDQPSRHVMLDARIVALERGDLLNLGVQWNWPGISAGTFSDSEHHGGGAPERVDWPWGVQIGYTPGQEFTNSLMMTLNLLAENQEATVIASPQVLAQDGQEAEIKVVTQEYFKISQESYMYTRFELETIETGTTLTITPRIGDNNEITLEIATEVSDVIARGEDNLPVVTRRTTKNTVRIEDGGTTAVAGLMDTRKRSEKSRAPGLASIPVVGGLFRNTSESESARHVSVFITARLMPEKGLTGSGAPEERTQFGPAGEEFRKALEESLSLMNTKTTTR